MSVRTTSFDMQPAYRDRIAAANGRARIQGKPAFDVSEAAPSLAASLRVHPRSRGGSTMRRPRRRRATPTSGTIMAFRYRITINGGGVAPPGHGRVMEIETKRKLPAEPSEANRAAVLDALRAKDPSRAALDFEGWPELVGEVPDTE
jgi:hypothetical protein